MKKLMLLALIAISAASCSGFKVTGNVDGVTGKVYLAYMEGKTPVIKDSTMAIDGKFSFVGALKLPILAQIQDSTKHRVVSFMLENNAIEITGSMAQVDSIQVVGSKEHDLFVGVTKSIATAKSYDAYVDTLKNFVTANPKSIAAAYTLYRQLTPAIDYNQMRAYVAGFDTTVRSSVYLTLVEERAALLESTAPGHKFVDFSAADTTGNAIALSSVAGQGKWVLLDFWASWCAPCRHENPTLTRAFRTFKDKNFTIFGVSLDKNREDWIGAIVKDTLGGWTNVSDLKFWEAEAAGLYGIGSIPSNVLIDPTGVIYERNIRGERLLEVLSEVLATEPVEKAK